MTYVEIWKKNLCRNIFDKIGMHIPLGAVFGENLYSTSVTHGGAV